MNPVAFTVFGLGIRWYGILIATGMLLGILIASNTSKVRDVDYDSFIDMLLVAIPIGIIGARLYYVVFSFNDYKNNLISVFDIRQGGLAIHGGIIFGLLAAYLYSRRKKINLVKYMDVAAPSIILAQSIGRWGNFMNQEAHGGPVSYQFISKFPKFIQNGMLINGTYYQPTFLYESLWDFTVFIILLITVRKSKMNGTVFATYLGLYSIGRFFIEGMRTDSLFAGFLRIAQVMSLVGIAIWIVVLITNHYRKKKLA